MDKSKVDYGDLEKLTCADDYHIWKFEITVLFKACDVYEIVSGDIKIETKIKDEDKKEWMKKDAVAQKLIIQSIDKKHVIQILNCSNSKEMFDKICSLYDGNEERNKCGTLQDFFNFSYKEGQSMTQFLADVESIAHRLNKIGQNLQDEMIISKILSSLPGNYKYFITAWESAPTTEKSLEKLKNRLLGEETRQEKPEEHNLSFKTTVSKVKYNVKCFKCQKNGHISKYCNNNKIKECSICKKNNHTDKNCYFRNKNNLKSYKNNISMMVNVNKTCDKVYEKNKSEIFIIDSGSTIHMTNKRELLHDIKYEKSNVFVAKSGESMSAEAIGSISCKNFTLKNVLYVPELAQNILSVSAMTKNNAEVIFHKNCVTVLFDSEVIIKGVSLSNGLYSTKIYCNNNETSMLAANNESAYEWHVKMGHPCNKILERFTECVEGVSLNKNNIKDLNQICEICLKAKQTRKPFSSTRQRAKRILEIIHSDVCGPVECTTWDGMRYVLTVLDDYTHLARVYLLKNKSEVSEYLKCYINEAERETKEKVSVLRCDNGGEYTGNEFKKWCRQMGVKLDYSVKYSPQQNGKAERLNRTLFEKARAILFDSELTKQMWGEAIRVATYLYNRLPTETSVTPYEQWFNKKPDVSIIKPFGCKVFVKKLGHLRKLDPRSMELKMIGYAKNGYRLWNNFKRRVEVQRDVIFDTKRYKDFQNSHETNNNSFLRNIEIPYILENEPGDVLNKPQLLSEDISNELQLPEDPDEENSVRSDSENIQGMQDNVNLESDESFYECDVNTEDQEINQRPKRNIKRPQRYDDYVLLTYNEAVSGDDKEKWMEAIKNEINSLNSNNTWTIVDKIPEGKKPIHSKWVFKIKRDNDGNILKYKARLVAKGFEQNFNDYFETYSPVVRVSSLRVLFSLAVQFDWYIDHWDIETAFLHGTLNEDVYMCQPEGHIVKGKENGLCKLNKALYGLKQAANAWHNEITTVLLNFGFEKSKYDPCVFIIKNVNQYLILAIYVDDLFVIGNNFERKKQLFNALQDRFKVKILGPIQNALSLRIRRQKDVMYVDQKHYIQSVLETFNMANCKTVSSPMVMGLKLIKNEQKINPNIPYQSLIGSLMYIAVNTRPDVLHSVCLLSQFNNSYNDEHFSHAKRILRYLKGTINLCMMYKKSEINLYGYVDADWANSIQDRRSYSGFVFKIGCNTISWECKKQNCVALSSTEAEYIALTHAAKEAIFLRNFIGELYSEINLSPVLLYNDNQSSHKIAQNRIVNNRTKHIDIRYHFIQDSIVNNKIDVKYLCTEEMVADVLTKTVHGPRYNKFYMGLSLCNKE
jgi:hypothetical protein